jgi:glycosyltransferase involved in cell wall biosynthesis
MLKRDDIFRVGYLGQLDRRKRVDLLITAFRRSDLDELVIGGAGADETRLRSLVDGDPRIKFLGVVPDRSLADFYSSLSVFAFPTWAEGYGLPAVEAMACKVPVIMLIDAHVPEEVRKRCLITDRLDYLLGNRKYLEGRCAAIHTEGNYTWAKEHDWDEAVRQYIALYEEITG